jgi:hypothetical protein
VGALDDDLCHYSAAAAAANPGPARLLVTALYVSLLVS